jgi:glycosyltransferase involved in cell wall biosynthesis
VNTAVMPYVRPETDSITGGDRRLRVAFLSDHLGHANGRIHGVTTYFLETLPAFDRARVTPMLCILQPRHQAASRFAAAGVEPIFLGRTKSDPRAFMDVLGILGRESIDVLHVSGLKSLLLGRTAARLKGCPVVAHFHDTIPPPTWMQGLQRRLASSTELALAVSNPIRDFVIREFAIPSSRTQVLYNGLRTERFAHPAADARIRIRQEWGLDPSIPVIGVIGRVHPDKGQKLMIRVMPRVLRDCSEAVLVITGDGPDREACIGLVKGLGLGAKVRFTGQRDDIPDLLAAVDVVVVPSLWEEPFPFVALEAMAAGRPVVAFRTGGLSESIVEGETGYLVPLADEDALAAAVSRLVCQPRLARRLGEGAARRAQEFSIGRHVQQLEELYAAVASRFVPAADRS